MKVCPESHTFRRGTSAECGDCPLRRERINAERTAELTALAPAVYEGMPSTAETTPLLPVLPAGMITDAARKQAQEIIEATLDKAERVLTRHVAFPSRAALDIVLMWLAHVNARERDDIGTPGELIWRATPRLLVTSKKNGSGKSTLLDLVAPMSGSRFGRMPYITAPGYADMMDKFNEPVIIDDAKNVFGRGEGHARLQGYILSGYTPDVVTFDGRKGGTPRNVFGPVAYAGNDDLITGSITSSLRDLLARSIIIRMKRPNRFYMEIDDAALYHARMCNQGFAEWSYIMAPELRQAARTLAQQAVDVGELDPADVDAGMLRKVQLHRPLIACADVIGGRWPEAMRTAASTGSQAADILADLTGDDADLGTRKPVTFTDE